MGGSSSKAIKSLLDDDSGEHAVRKVFDSLDENKGGFDEAGVFIFVFSSSFFLDGALSFEEWQAASKALYDAIRGEAEEKVV